MKFSNEKLKYINKLAKEFNSYKRKAYLIKEYSEELNNEKEISSK